MTYDAEGNLLCRKTFITSSTVPSETRDFIGNIEYVNNVIAEVQHEQGRYKSIGTNTYRHEYTIADHLGNTRIVYTDTDSNGVVNHTYDILDENHYYAYGMELPGTFINVAGTNYNYKFNGIERVESFGMDFAFYRGLDPILGRWYGVDLEAEMYANMSPYCAMNNNPGNEVDPLGDSPIHVGAAIIGAGINMYNNWSSIVRNPWSAIGYAGTGALAGFVSVNGGAAAAAKITAIGNLATDAMTGNAPDIKSVNDAFNYGVKTVSNSIDVGGAGKLAKAGFMGLASLGSEWAADAIEPYYETVYFNVVSESGITNEGVSYNRILSYDTKQVLSLGAPSVGFGKFSAGAVSGQLGVSNNGYTKSTTAQGRAKHDLYKVNDVDENAGRIKEYNKIKGMRPDFIDIDNKTVYELKPNNPRSIARGNGQLDRYAKELSKKFGDEWKKVLDLY